MCVSENYNFLEVLSWSNFLRALHFLDSPWFHQNTFDLFFPRSISDYRAGYPTAIPTADYIL